MYAIRSYYENEIPIFAGGGVGKNGNLAANAAALIMLGASGVQIGKYVMQAAAGCLGSESDRCNICNIGLCPKGITSQDPRLVITSYSIHYTKLYDWAAMYSGPCSTLRRWCPPSPPC